MPGGQREELSMSRLRAARLIPLLLLLPGAALPHSETHEKPADFLAGVLDGRIEVLTEGGLELGAGRVHLEPKAESSSELRSPAFAGFLGTPPLRKLQSPTGSLGPEGLTPERFQFSPPIGAVLADSEWFEGSLLILMKPGNAPPTAMHLYRIRTKPSGEMGGPELYALAPPGQVLTQIARIEGRFFAASRIAGEDRLHLLELKQLGAQQGGWSDFGPLPAALSPGWGMVASGESLALLSPASRQAYHTHAPRINETGEWIRTPLNGGDWGDAARAFLGRIGSARDDSALVFNEFYLPETASLESLTVRFEGEGASSLRYRIAKSPDDWFEDWSDPVPADRLHRIDRPGRVVQYQLVHEPDSPPAKVIEVKLDWSLQESPTENRWHVSSSNLRLEAHDVESLFRRHWRSWNRKTHTEEGVAGRAAMVVGTGGSSSSPDGEGDEGKAPSHNPHTGVDSLAAIVAEQVDEKDPEFNAPIPRGNDPRVDSEFEKEGESDTSPNPNAEMSDPGANQQENRGPSNDDSMTAAHSTPLSGSAKRNAPEPNSDSPPFPTSVEPSPDPNRGAPSHAQTSPGEAVSKTGSSLPQRSSPAASSPHSPSPGAESSPGPQDPRGGQSVPADFGSDSGSASGGNLQAKAAPSEESNKSEGPEGDNEASKPIFGGDADPNDPSANPAQGGNSIESPGSAAGSGGMSSSNNRDNQILGSSGEAGGREGASSAEAPGESSPLGPPAPVEKNPDIGGPIDSGVAETRKTGSGSPVTGAEESQEMGSGGRGSKLDPTNRLNDVLARLLPEKSMDEAGRGVVGAPALGTVGSRLTPNRGNSSNAPFHSTSIHRLFADHPFILVALLWPLLFLLTELIRRLLRNRGWGIDSAPPFLQPSEVSLIDWERARREEETAESNRDSARSAAGPNPRADLALIAADLPNEPPPTARIDWTVADPLPQPMASAGAFYRNGQVYVVDPHGTVCSARINADGSLRPWYVRMGHLPAQVGTGGVAVLQDRVVCQIGTKLYTAEIDDSGIGPWQEAGSLDGLTGKTTLVGSGDRILFIGGQGEEGKLPLVRSARIGIEGRIEDLENHPALPIGLRESGCAIEGGRVYLAGGRSGNQVSSLVLSAPLDASGRPGAWRVEAEMPEAMRRPTLQAWKGNLWVVGGRDGRSTKIVLAGRLGSDGVLQGWQRLETDLPEPVTEGAAARAGGRLLLLGGRDARDYGKTLREVYWLEPRLG